MPDLRRLGYFIAVAEERSFTRAAERWPRTSCGGRSRACSFATSRLELVRGTADRPDATIETDAGTLSAVLWQGRPLAAAVRSGDVMIEGSQPAVTRFLGLFPAPEPAPIADSVAHETEAGP